MDRSVMGPFPVNQLQFSLNPSGISSTVPGYVKPPKPIVIDKFNSGNLMMFTVQQPSAEQRQYLYLSQDSLSEAVQAAQHDVLWRKGIETRSDRDVNTHRVNYSKAVKSAERINRINRRQQPGYKQKLVIKERVVNNPVRNMVTQTRSVSAPAVDLFSLPVRSMSPPTRDLSQEDQMSSDIRRMQSELTKYLEQIKQFQVNPPSSRVDEEISERMRRATRAEEQLIRSARVVYTLNQQISKFLEQLRHTNIDSVTAVKKRELVSRIASLYRAVVRAIQSYVRQLSDVDVCPNVTSGCGDLIGVVRGLLSCSQLLNITLSPDSMGPLLDEIMVRCSSNTAGGDNLNKNQSASVANKRQSSRTLPSKGLQPAAGVGQMSVAMSNAQRQSELRAGIRQLMISYDGPSRDKPVSKQSRKSQGRTKARSVLIDRRNQKWQLPVDVVRKDESVVNYVQPTLTTMLKERSKVAERTTTPAVAPKVRPNASSAPPPPLSSPRERLARFLRRRSRSQSPNRSFDRLVADGLDGRHHHRSKSLSNDEDSRRDFRRRHSPSTVPNVSWQSYPISSESNEQMSSHRSASPSPSRCYACQHKNGHTGLPRRAQFGRNSPTNRSRSEEFWRSMPTAERQLNRSPHRSRRQLGVAVDGLLNRSQSQLNASHVSQAILDDLVSDVSRELHSYRRSNEVDRQAAYMMDRPSVETLLQRLHEIELEQDSIRQRWTTLVYSETDRVAPNQNTTNQVIDGSRATDSVILFTKPILGTNHREHFQVESGGRYSAQRTLDLSVQTTATNLQSSNQHAVDLLPGVRDPDSLRLRLNQDLVDKIETNVRNYEQFLRVRSHNVESRFSPWMAMEEMAEEILKSCINDVVTEMDQINNEIVDTVYGAEFKFSH